jgi:hypothetical protein
MSWFGGSNNHERDIKQAKEKWKVQRIEGEARKDHEQGKISRGEYEKVKRASRGWKAGGKQSGGFW